jgi:hypothetical protein
MILLFKTNLNKTHETLVRKLLSNYPEIIKVDFDFEDCDKVLKIDTKEDLTKKTIALLHQNDILCEELE